jgi:hypothetical protein
MTKKGIFIFLILCSRSAVNAQSIPQIPSSNTLKADHFIYREKTKLLQASSNVVWKNDTAEIKTPSLSWNLESNIVITHGKTKLKQPNLELVANSLEADLNKKHYTLHDIHIKTDPFIVQSKMAKQTSPTENRLKESHLTTCELNPPHYHLESQDLKFVPNDHMEGWGVVFKNKYLNPLGIWMPYYRYDLKKRRIHWNIPVIGKRDVPGWGWFVQNTIDYDQVDNRDSSLLLDLFEYKGIGFGTQHQYKWNNHSGTFSYYQLKEQDTGILNEKIGLTDRIIWDAHKVSTFNIQRIDAERLERSGRQVQDIQEVSLSETYPNQTTLWNAKNIHNKLQKSQTLTASIKNTKAGQEDYSIDIFQNNNQTITRNDFNANAFHTLTISPQMKLNTHLDYHHQEVGTRLPENILKSDFKLKNTFTENITTTLRVTTLTNLDGERTSRDIQLNRFFYRLPELQIQVSPTLNFGKWTHTLTIARYQESYITGQNVQRIYPDPQNFAPLPNTYIYNQTFSVATGNAKREGQWSLQTQYAQYVFDTTGKDIFSGDALYTIGGTVSYKTDWHGFWQTNSQYQRVFAPPENNSPFYEFTDSTQGLNSLYETITFYIHSPETYAWIHETGYDWEARRWRDYKTTALARPIPDLKLSLSTGKRLNPTLVDINGSFLPTTWISEWTPQNTFTRIGYTLSLDTNALIHQKKTKIQQSNLIVAFPFGDTDPLYQWNLSMSFAYDTLTYPDTFTAAGYQLQTLELVKFDHCQTFSLGYNKLNQTVSFKYTINAFPESPLELIQTNNTIRFGGQLQSNSQERF